MIEDLRNFKALADNLNFSRTAAMVNMSPSAFTRSIERFEKSVGVPLFNRNSRNVSLTLPGETLYKGVVNIIESYDALIARARLLSKDDSIVQIGGHLSIPGIITFAEAIRTQVEEMRKPYAVAFNPVHIASEIRQPGLLDPAEQINSEGNDVSLVFTHAGMQKNDRTIEPLYDLPYQAFMSSESRFQDGQNISLIDLKDYTFVLTDTYESYWKGLLESCKKAGFTPKTTTKWNRSTVDYLHPNHPDEVFILVEGASYVEQLHKTQHLVELRFPHDPHARMTISAAYSSTERRERVLDCLEIIREVASTWKKIYE